MQKQERSVYRRGADDGFLFGAYLSVLILLSCMGLYYPVLGLPSLLMMALVPVIIYRFLRRSYVREYGLSTFSELWLQGIVTFVCGTMIMAVAAYLYIRFLKPEFLADLVQTAADSYRSIGTPDAVRFADMLDAMMERHMIPAPIYVVTEIMLMGIFSGSILSMIITWMVRLRKVRSGLDDMTPRQ